jgi:RNA polymerase sigma-70 factor, ECF subfamily
MDERAQKPGAAPASVSAGQGGQGMPRPSQAGGKAVGVTPEEQALVARLRAGDEAAYTTIVTMYYSAMLRLALMYVADRAVAEEVIQETWLSVLQGLDRFEGRSSLKTWIFHILVNRAKTRGQREGRSVPFSALGGFETEDAEPAVDPSRFRPPGAPQWPGGWATPPQSWQGMPEERALSGETREQIAEAIAMLPPSQQTVIRLRDVEGWSAEEVCGLLGISEINQRVLLHRARSKVRGALERYLAEDRAC